MKNLLRISISIYFLWSLNFIAQQNGYLKQHVILKDFNNACSIASVDFDGDGDNDIVATSFDGSYISWLENDGLQNFTEHKIIEDFGQARVLDIAKIDDDDDYDIVATAESDEKISWFENDGKGNFTEHVVIENWTASGFVMARDPISNVDIDFDNDGDTDLLATSIHPGNRVSWFENDGNQNFTEHIVKENWYWARYCTVVDIDFDGDLDFLGTAKSGEIILFENDGKANFTEHVVINDWGETSSVQAADLDNDGDLDLAATSVTKQEVAWLENDGSNNFDKHTIKTGFDGAFSVTIVDIDKDNDLDILSLAWIGGLVSVFENDGTCNFNEYNFCDDAYDLIKIFPVDLDLDGDIDILGACYSQNDIRWWENLKYNMDFDVEITSGHVPLSVQFFDNSVFADPINEWEWDFDSNGIIDSYEKNPEWVFTEPGIYDVELVVKTQNMTRKRKYEALISVFNGESSIHFTDTDSRIVVNSNEAYDLTDMITIEADIYPTDWAESNNGMMIFSNSSIKLYATGYVFGPTGDYSIAAKLKMKDEKVVRLTAPSNIIELEKWHHIAFTYNSIGNEANIYINGEKQEISVLGSSELNGGLYSGDTKEIIIGNTEEFAEPFIGRIDEFRIWNKIRSVSELVENMDNLLDGDEDGLVGYWNMNEGRGNIIIDFSSTKNDGILEKVKYAQGVDLSALTGFFDYQNELAQNFQLKQNYPNPFNPSTKIQYTIPDVGTGYISSVRMEIYNILGKKIKTLVNGYQPAGVYEVDFDANNLPTGIYFYTIYAEQFSDTKKMLLMK